MEQRNVEIQRGHRASTPPPYIPIADARKITTTFM